jgi:glycosyltransferase involved in cell wall biosynthesis
MKIKKIAVIAVGSASWQGGIQYIINFIAGVNALAEKQEHKIEILLIKESHQEINNLDEFPFLKIIVLDKYKGIPQVNFFQKAVNFTIFKLFKLNYSPRLINFLKLEKVDFVYPMALPLSTGLNAAGWVADFQHRNFPDVINQNFTKQAEVWIESEFKNSSKVVLSSNFCKSDCSKFFPDYLSKTVVMPFAVHISKKLFNSKFLVDTQKKYEFTNPFLLVSNLFAITKNHKIIFDALGILKAKGLEITLICTGNIIDSRDLSYANQILESVTINKIRNQVHFLGLIPREEQMSLYRLSLAMIQPSLSEGWSTCVEEAKAIGKDMLLSNIEVHKEQWPNNAWFFDPYNALDLANKIGTIYNLNHSKIFPDLEREINARNEYKNNFADFSDAILNVITKK